MEGIVELLIATEAPMLEGRFSPDPDAGAFFASGNCRAALEDLAARLRAVATDADRVRRLVELAESLGCTSDNGPGYVDTTTIKNSGTYAIVLDPSAGAQVLARHT